MDRRGFLKKLGTGIAVAAVCTDPWCGSIAGNAIVPHEEICGLQHVVSIPETLGDYYDYTNFSSFAVQESIDDMTKNAAAELGRQAGISMKAMLERVYDTGNSAV